MNARTARDTIVFVCLASGLGGSTRSVSTVLERGDRLFRGVVAAPSNGSFLPHLRRSGLAADYIVLPDRKRGKKRRTTRFFAAARIAGFALRHRRRIAAFHANGPEELIVVAPAAALTRRPVVVWSHARDVTSWTSRLVRIVGPFLPRVRWSAVSREATRVISEAGLVTADRVEIVPDPIDAADVRVESRVSNETVVVGYLGSDAPYKGFQLIPQVIQRLNGTPIRWLVFSRETSADNRHAWKQLRSLHEHVTIPGKVPDVRDAYARCDVVFCPSLEESFGRVVAEAMINGIPVVASELGPVRDLLGDDEAGLLFPPGDPVAAAIAINRIAGDPALRRALGANGRARAMSFDPDAVAERLRSLYGVAG